MNRYIFNIPVSVLAETPEQAWADVKKIIIDRGSEFFEFMEIPDYVVENEGEVA